MYACEKPQTTKGSTVNEIKNRKQNQRDKEKIKNNNCRKSNYQGEVTNTK